MSLQNILKLRESFFTFVCVCVRVNLDEASVKEQISTAPKQNSSHSDKLLAILSLLYHNFTGTQE